MSDSYGTYVGSIETRTDGSRNIEIWTDTEGVYLKEHNNETNSTKKVFVPARKMSDFLMMFAEAAKENAEKRMMIETEGGH